MTAFQSAPADRSWIAGFCGNLSAGLRLMGLARIAPDRIAASPDQLIFLVVAGLAVNLAAAFAFIGTEGRFSFTAAPSTVFGVLLLLLSGHLIGTVARDRRLTLLVPVAVAAASISLNIVANLIWLALDRGWLGTAVASDSMALYYVLFGWWSIAMLVAVARFAAVRSFLAALVFAAVVLLPTWYVPPGWLWEETYHGGEAPAGVTLPTPAMQESLLYSQPGLLRDALAGIGRQRPGIEDLYFVGFAPYASQDVFMKEVESVRKAVAQRFDIGPRSIVLVNNPSVLESRPVATLTSLRRALRAIGERIDPAEDVVLVHVTTHGSESHELSVDLPPLRLAPIRPADLRAALDDARIRWRIVVVSACYAGGFVDALKSAHTMVVTAADARHASFGCSSDSDYTYFSRAFYEEALRKTGSLAEAFALARESVSVRERRENLEPSNPQLFVGEAIGRKLAGWPREPVRPGQGKVP